MYLVFLSHLSPYNQTSIATHKNGFDEMSDCGNYGKFMALAIKEAQRAWNEGEVPVGALVVRDGKVIARAHNLKESTNDPTAHAEMLALRRASQELQSWRLSDCDLYVTLEPCMMCAGALVQSRIRRLIYGAPDPKGGAIKSLFAICSDSKLNHQVEIQSGVMADLSSNVLKQFFKARR